MPPTAPLPIQVLIYGLPLIATTRIVQQKQIKAIPYFCLCGELELGVVWIRAAWHNPYFRLSR